MLQAFFESKSMQAYFESKSLQLTELQLAYVVVCCSSLRLQQVRMSICCSCR